MRIATTPLLSQEHIARLYNVDPETGIATHRLRPPITPGARMFNRRYGGQPVGYRDPLGYIMVIIDGQHYQLHRLLYKLATGNDPGPILDHVNGDPTDNRIANLRPCNIYESNANRIRRKATYTNARGVTPDGSRYRMRIQLRGIIISRNYPTLDAAHQAALIARRALHGPFTRT